MENRKTFEEMFKEKFEQVSGKECDEVVLSHMNYVIELLKEVREATLREAAENVRVSILYGSYDFRESCILNLDKNSIQI